MLVCVLSLGNLSKFHRECLDSAVEPFLASLWDPFKTGKPSGSPDKWARTELSSAVHATSETGRGLVNCFIHCIQLGSEGQGAAPLTLPWKRYLAGVKLLDSKNNTSILATDYPPPSKPECQGISLLTRSDQLTAIILTRCPLECSDETDSKNDTSILATDYLPPSKPECPGYFFAYQIWSAHCHHSNTMPCGMFRWDTLCLDLL